ncbi:thioredoxin domain-containing protein [Paracoccus litorisediminis]|uniref:thioredoxin domain-containing protein n=1 Tax=Paracoccus litorisediminis TaxID=2006130 RepID=UPI00373282A1
MKELTKAAALLAVFLPVQALAQPGPPSDQAIRDWIMANPEVIISSLQNHEAKQRQVESDRQGQTALALRAEIVHEAPLLGNPDGSFEIMMFSDYRCPHCRRTHAAVAEFLARHDDTRVSVREWPILGEASILGARYALAINQVLGQKAYEAASERIFTAGQQLGQEWIDADLRGLGDRSDEVQAAMATKDGWITGHLARGGELAQTIGINGTPFLIVGETVVAGAATLEELEEIHARETAIKQR